MTPPAAARSDSPPPIFVGGVARSGTTIIGRLLGSHCDYRLIPTEAVFHCAPEGLPGVLCGTTTPATFARTMAERWYHPIIADPDVFDRALHAFLEQSPRDPVAAGAALTQTLFGGCARAHGRRGWVEMTPGNATDGAPQLAEMFPQLRLIHTIRDGRDVASSLVGLGWKRNARDALAWWERGMVMGHESCGSLADGALHVVRFSRLVLEDRDAALEELLSFLGWDDEREMSSFFAEQMTAENAHVGRWRTHFQGAERAFVEAEYEAILERLRVRGIAVP